jgi:alpha-mannosidase
MPNTTFEWQGIDGTSVIVHFPPADTYNSHATVKGSEKQI